jgi:hypothetical protein
MMVSTCFAEIRQAAGRPKPGNHLCPACAVTHRGVCFQNAQHGKINRFGRGAQDRSLGTNVQRVHEGFNRVKI